MITFNNKDFYLPHIIELSGLNDIKLKYNYHVFGLKNANNSAIYIDTNMEFTNLADFLNKNKILFEWDTSHDDTNLIRIGLRKDVREFVNKNNEPEFAATILKTIVFSFEESIKGLTSYKLKMEIPPIFNGMY